MEPDGGCAAGPNPELCRRQVSNDRNHVFTNLLDGVSGRLEQRLNAMDRAAEPDLGR